jgi:hypothetical protein
MCSSGGTAVFQDPDEAPLCESASLTETIPPGSAFETCRAGAVLAKEISSQFKACGASIPDGPTTCGSGEPASEGPFNILVPDLTKSIGNAFLTPYHLEIADSSGDRVPQPGETITAKLSLLNAGPITLTGVTAVLSSPPIDLTQDGTTNAVALGIPVASSSYPDIVGSPITGGTDCSSPPGPPNPSVNTTAFSISIPSNHPGDVGRPFNLAVSGLASGTPFQMDVPIVIGIGSACSLSNIDGHFDGVNGLLNPMARLVKAGDVVTYAGPFQQGKTRPLKMQVLCQGVSLSDQQILPPQIVGLSRNGVALDISTLNLNADPPNPNAPLFRYGSGWTYNLSTKFLTRATYVMTIRLGGDQDYVTGFILN